MAFSKDDLIKLGDLMDEKMDKRDERLTEKIGDMMDERMLKFHEQVTEPMINNVVESLHDDMSNLENRLGKRIDVVEDNTYRIERKLDNISDHHSVKIDEHEKRIGTLERRIIVSL